MDVKCSTCGEPWDTHHLIHDEVWETNLTVHEKEDFIASKHLRLYEKEFNALGWRFVNHNILCIRRCPCCPPDAKPNKESIILKGCLSDLLGDDLDALAVELEDYDEYTNNAY